MNLIFFKTSADFGKWLKKYHSVEKELWVGFYKKTSGKKSITYPESLDQAISYGWIDGLKKSIDEISYMQRFTPRKPSSIWSKVNLNRIEELKKLGLVHPAGLKIYEARDKNKIEKYSFEREKSEFDESLLKIFRDNTKAWDFFSAQPPSYRKVAVFWVSSAKKDETRVKRLTALILDSENHKRLAIVTLKKE
jgi:uncharacterized protein YdeI (YjbR/CyaY-like superfamily)